MAKGTDKTGKHIEAGAGKEGASGEQNARTGRPQKGEVTEKQPRKVSFEYSPEKRGSKGHCVAAVRAHCMASDHFICAEMHDYQPIAINFCYPPSDPLRKVFKRVPKVTSQMGEDLFVPLDRLDDFGTPGRHVLSGAFMRDQHKGGLSRSRPKSPSSESSRSASPKRKGVSPGQKRRAAKRIPRYAYQLDEDSFKESGLPMPLCFARPHKKTEIYETVSQHEHKLPDLLEVYGKKKADDEDVTPVTQGMKPRARSRSVFSVRFAAGRETPRLKSASTRLVPNIST